MEFEKIKAFNRNASIGDLYDSRTMEIINVIDLFKSTDYKDYIKSATTTTPSKRIKITTPTRSSTRTINNSSNNKTLDSSPSTTPKRLIEPRSSRFLMRSFLLLAC